MNVEQFGARLHQLLLEKSESEYVRVTDLCSSIAEALSPQKISIVYPRALYSGGTMITVNSRDEEAQALTEGYSSTPPPQFAPGFPQHFREKLTTEGGGKWPSGDVRKVMIKTQEDLRLFHSVVDEEQWTVDTGDRGGRGIGIGDLVQERRARLAAMVAAKDFAADAVEAADAPVEDFGGYCLDGKQLDSASEAPAPADSASAEEAR
jgi:hypothetical protein